MAWAAAAAALASFAGNQFSSAINSSRSWKYAQRAMALQDQYQRGLMRDQYSLSREGLEKAGYNPLLALGGSSAVSSVSPTTMNSDSDSGQQAVASALQAQQVKNETEQTKSNIASQDASSALANEQAKTEQSKRVNFDFQNAMLDVQKHLADKDLSWYDRKSNASLYESMQRAERYQAQSAIDALNAETRKQEVANNYALGKYKNETERKRSKFQNFSDYHNAKYGNPLKTAGYSWDKNTIGRQGGYPEF